MARSASSLSTEQLAPLEVRRDEEIFATDGGWFRARRHFSFDEYNDPANMGIGTLRVFNHDTLAPGALWPMHPHRDVEGITYVVAGHFERGQHRRRRHPRSRRRAAHDTRLGCPAL